MSSFELQIEPRDEQYGRFAASIIRALKLVVGKRLEEGLSQAAIAERADCHPSHLSRLLNGRVNNITIRTVSDILWACEAEPSPMQLDFFEDLSPNGCFSDRLACLPEVLVFSEPRTVCKFDFDGRSIADPSTLADASPRTETFWSTHKSVVCVA